MNPHEYKEAVSFLAQGMLKVHFAERLTCMNSAKGEKCIRTFLKQEIPGSELGRMSEKNLVQLFEKYCEFKQIKNDICLYGQCGKKRE